LTLRVAEVRETRVRLEWQYEGPPVPGFILEGDVIPGGRTYRLDMGMQTHFEGRVAPGRYYARVRSVGDPAASVESEEIPLLVEQSVVPSAPAHLVATVHGARVGLQWVNTFTGGTPTAVGLLVSGAAQARIALGVVDQITFGGVPSGDYTLQLVASNGAGESPASAPVTVRVPGTCAVPSAPTWVTWSVSDRRVTLHWQPPASGDAPTDYRVTAADYGSATTAGVRVIGGTVPPGTYRVWVEAINACGTSASSVVQTIVVP
jgi:predicted phage tail protein